MCQEKFHLWVWAPPPGNLRTDAGVKFGVSKRQSLGGIYCTSGQHFFYNFEFCAEILGSTNSSMHWLLFGQFLKKVFGARAHAACLYKVNQFSEWIQAFWSLLRRNAAFSQNTNIHHFLQISTSFEKSVETWVLWICPIFVDFFLV